MPAVAARRIEPRNADAIALLDVRDARANCGDMADALVARDEWRVVRAPPMPTAATWPTPSWPGMNGGLGLTGQSPSAACKSVWQTPLAAILTRIWPACGLGTGTSSMTRGCLNFRTTAAFMVLVMQPPAG